MFKTLMTATAASALALSVALAQGTAPAPAQKPSTDTMQNSQTPSTDTKAMDDKSTDTKPTDSTMNPSAAKASAGLVVISKQQPDQILASKFQGTDVVGTDDKKIGDVSDVLFAKDGSVVAYVIGIGGFLGIGSKDIALDPTSLEVVPGTNGGNMKLRVAMTKDELTQAASFERYQPPRPAATNAPATRRPIGAPPPASQ